MKKVFLPLVVLLSLMTSQLTASNWIPITSTIPAPARTQLVSSTIERSVVHFTLSGFTLRDVQTPSGTASVVEVAKGTPIQEAGAPDLPKLTVSLIIPDRASTGVRVVSSAWRDFPGITIAPSKGVIMRTTDPATVPYSYGPSYGTDAYYPGMTADTRDPYIIRDVRGQTLISYPFQYNPVTKVLRVYYDLTVELYSSDGPVINPVAKSETPKRIPGDFLPVLKHQFANLPSLDYLPLEEYGDLLIICHAAFMDAMQPYVDWKRAEGYHTELIPRDSAGSTAFAIKAYINNYYLTHGLTHVLLVGDAAQVPTNTGGGLGGPSDNAYGYLAGNDHYADVFVGRFSAETEDQVITQVQRTLDYEQNPGFLTDDWYTTVTGIASDQGPGDDGEMDYEHVRNQQTKLLGYTYTANPELFDGSQGGNDAPGNPSPAQVSTEVNNGGGLILYTGHGSKTSWGTSGFSNSNVTQLTNAGKLPFIWSVACQNGNFVNGSACFAEAWLRASQSGEPTGALAFLGSTIDQSWNSPMEGQDAMTDILIESDSSNIKRTFAGLSINGCMEMIDAYGTDGSNMADTWTIFGDPTVMVRSAAPQPMDLAYDTVLYAGDSVIRAFCSVAGARITATLGDAILATSLTSGDTLYLAFSPLQGSGDSIRLVATAYNRIPAQGLVPVLPLAPVNAGFTGVPERVIPGNSVAFTDLSLGHKTYWHWTFPGGNPATSEEENPVVTYDTKGTYDVTLLTGNMLYSDTLVKPGYITVDFPEGIAGKADQFSCLVTPNPGNGHFTVNLASGSDESLMISIFDLTGTKIDAFPFSLANGKGSLKLDLTAQTEGIYLLRVEGTNSAVCRKLIVRK